LAGAPRELPPLLHPGCASQANKIAAIADFKITNLKEIKDSAADRDYDVEARFARSHLDSKHLGVSYFRYGRGYRAPFGHRHREQEEAYVVVSGSGRVRLDDEVVDLRQWDVIRVAPQVVRGFEGGPEGLEVIAIGSDRPEGGDGEMVRDFWRD
jgi:mannose-6-phosphate isomerase-like protein (cupin superfamily)